MSKIIIINGSPRKNRATATLLHRIETELTILGNDIKYIDISDLSIEFCNGCCSCYKSGKCFINDDAEKISNEIECADGVIMASPTYASNVSGQLKTFIDRGHFVIEQLLHNKYAISVITGENYGSKDASKVLTKLLKYSGATLSGKIVLDLPFNGNSLDNKKIERRIVALSIKFDKDIKEKRKSIFQQLFHKIIFSVGIKPFVLKKEKEYKGVLNRWRSYGVID